MVKIAWMLLLIPLAVFVVGCDAIKSEEQIAKEAVECTLESGNEAARDVVRAFGGVDRAAEEMASTMTKEEIIRERDRECD
jgi:hypothetical protein